VAWRRGKRERARRIKEKKEVLGGGKDDWRDQNVAKKRKRIDSKKTGAGTQEGDVHREEKAHHRKETRRRKRKRGGGQSQGKERKQKCRHNCKCHLMGYRVGGTKRWLL